MSMSETKRKRLYLNGDPDKPITASGVLIYKNVSGRMQLLIIYANNKYEDIGGKIDINDSSIYDSTGREIEEETNGVIKKQDIIDRLQNARYVYVPTAKYLVFIIKASSKEKKLQKTDFGNKEIHSNINRTIGWIDRYQFSNINIIKYKLNYRLRKKQIFDTLQSIENQFKYRKRLF
jgi:hypothetical protein